MLSLWALSSRASETETTGNILGSTWDGTYNIGYWGGTTGGESPNFGGGTTFYWGYGGGIVSQTIAINQALSQSGIQVEGFRYQWRIKNGNANLFEDQGGADDFVITVNVYKANGDLYRSYEYDYSYSHNWTNHTGTETFPDQFLDPSFFGNLSVEAEGNDVGWWAGHYGPEFNVSQSYIELTYSSNPCHLDPLYDPKCLGYTEAFLQKQLEEQLAQQQALMEEMMEQTAPVAEESTNEPIQESIFVVADVVFEPTVEIEQTKKSTGLTDNQKNALANADAQAKSAERVASNSSQQSMESSEQMMEELTGISVDGSVVSSVISGDSVSTDVLTLDPTASAIEQFSFSVSTTQSVALSKTTQQIEQTVSEKEEEQKEEMIEQVAESNEAEDMQLAMMGFNPNFSAYQQPQMPDANFYIPKEIYEGQKNYDNPNQRFFNGASDVLHQQLINLQYGR